MTSGTNELTVALEHLDNHLKAILKLKLREFVHLSPWFNDAVTVNLDSHTRLKKFKQPEVALKQAKCPNLSRRPVLRRRVIPLVLR